MFGRGGKDGVTVNDIFAAMAIQIHGGDGNDTVTGPNADITWTITGDGAGSAKNEYLRFDAVERLVGGTGSDFFNVTGGSMPGFDTNAGLEGGNGAGTDTLAGPETDNTWTLTGAGAGNLNTKTTFAGLENLLGNKKNDTFNVGAGSLDGLLDGGAPDDGTTSTDTLSFAGTTTVIVDLFLAKGGGIKTFANITKVVGSSSATDQLLGPAPLLDQVVWAITGINSGIVDGVTFDGFEKLKGRDATNDAFIFSGAGSIVEIDGGTGGLDGFAVLPVSGNLLVYQPAVGRDGRRPGPSPRSAARP